MNLNTYLVLPICILVLLQGCQKTQEESREQHQGLNEMPAHVDTVEPTQKGSDQIDQERVALGLKSFQTSCVSCHGLSSEPPASVAPKLTAIKKAYLQGGLGYPAFEKAIVDFVSAPEKATIKMSEAVERYGTMPNMGLSADVVQDIAYFIFHSDIDSPEWHEKTYPEFLRKAESPGQRDPLQIGQEIALQVKGLLGKNLLAAIREKGTAEAVTFCSEQALDLTRTKAAELGAQVKRVSDLNRNPVNKASPEELSYIQKQKSVLASGSKATPAIKEMDDKYQAYYPIMTNQMCLQCHGKPNVDIVPETLKQIQKRYPKDLATGYGPNELRGIWVVEWPKG